VLGQNLAAQNKAISGWQRTAWLPLKYKKKIYNIEFYSLGYDFLVDVADVDLELVIEDLLAQLIG
jgi:hypothetical protein